MLKGWKTYIAAALGAAADAVSVQLQGHPIIGPLWPVLMVLMRQASTTEPGLRLSKFWQRLKGG